MNKKELLNFIYPYFIYPYLIFILISIVAIYYRKKYLKIKGINRTLFDHLFEILLGIIISFFPFIITYYYYRYICTLETYSGLVMLFMISLSIPIFITMAKLGALITGAIVAIVQSAKVLLTYTIFAIMEFLAAIVFLTSLFR
ncbi:MAG: hypothetical protein AB6733_13675 [Clostridiaceae bacterium]